MKKKNITGKQRLSLPMLASGMTAVATANAVGVWPSTISEWRNQPHFVAALEKLREQSTREAMEQFQGTLSIAVGEVQRLISESKTDSTRLRAALYVIDSMKPTKATTRRVIDSDTTAELGELHQVLLQLGIGNAV